MTYDDGPHELGFDGTLRIFSTMYADCDDDSIIPIGSRRPTRSGGSCAPHYLVPLPVRYFREWLPCILEHEIGQTQYIMLNTLKPSALTKGTPAEYYAHLVKTPQRQRPYFDASTKNLQELNAMTMDLDVGRSDDQPSAHVAIGIAMAMAEDGVIPYPSIHATSGRGAYLFWLLRDPVTGRPPKYNSATGEQWNLVKRELKDRLSKLESDATALAHWYKRHGTTDTSTGNEVVYSTVRVRSGVTGDFSIPSYTLDGMCKALNLPWALIEARAVKARAVKAKPDKQRRLLAEGEHRRDLSRHKAYVREIEALVQHRSRIVEGSRTFVLRYYYMALLAIYKARHGDSEGARKAQNDTKLLNQQRCRPAMVDADLRRTVFGARPPFSVRNETAASHLGVTMEEGRFLGLRTLVPPELRSEIDAVDKAAKAAKHRRWDERERLLLATDLGNVEIARRLIADFGAEGNERKVAKRVSRAMARLRRKGLRRPAEVAAGDLSEQRQKVLSIVSDDH